MKPIFPRLLISILLVILLAACNIPLGTGTGTDTGTIATREALTLAASTQFTPQMLTASATSTALVEPSHTQTPTPPPTGTIGPTDTPTPTLHPTETLEPSITPIPAPGTIAGGIIGYPYGPLPGLAIVAFGQEPPYYYSYLITAAGETYFTMSSDYLIPGHFQLVAYDSSGHTGGCTVTVLVISNQTVNCDITNWGGGYPEKPASVPSP